MNSQDNNTPIRFEQPSTEIRTGSGLPHIQTDLYESNPGRDSIIGYLGLNFPH